MKVSLSEEERERRKRDAFNARGIDYDDYCRRAEEKKASAFAKKMKNIEENMLHPNHEDNIQYWLCS